MTSETDAEHLSKRLTVTRHGEDSWFRSSLLFHAGLMLFAFTQAQLGADDPAAWWLVTPFVAVLVLAAAGWIARDPRTGLKILGGGIWGSIGLLLLIYCYAALTMTS